MPAVLLGRRWGWGRGGETCALLGYSAANHSGMTRWKRRPLWPVRLRPSQWQPAGHTPTVSTGLSCASRAVLGEGVRKNKQEQGNALFKTDWPHGQCCQSAYQETVVEVSDGCYGPRLSLPRALGWPPEGHHHHGDTLPGSE